MIASKMSSFSAGHLRALLTWGNFWLLIATIGAAIFFVGGLDALLVAWQLPEYSHGPLIPILSIFLFLRQLKEYPPDPGPKRKRWIGFTVLVVAMLFGALGKLSNIDELVAYATIIWVGGILLVSFGWDTGKYFWPPVLHLIYMLPLPGVLYYKLSTVLQTISSELGVFFLQLINVPVFLEGNIIDLGVIKLHVAEACSGLRYLFPILSFSYIFAVLYRGPTWHKAVLLISAVPITVFMNSVRIAVAGYIVNKFSAEWLEGFTHFFEGWVIFVICILFLFLLAWVLLYFRKDRVSLLDALDLDTDGIGVQAMRLQYTAASRAMIAAAVLSVGFLAVWQAVPDRSEQIVARDTFDVFPRQLKDWTQQGAPEFLTSDVLEVLGADDYRQVNFTSPSHAASVGLFMAWYNDQSKGGVHSPEICLPGAGWEIAWLERTDVTQQVNIGTDFMINRAIIQKGETRMMVYYWFQQKNRRIAWDFAAKFWLMIDGIRYGRTDGALVRLTTVILPNETDDEAEVRLVDMLDGLQEPLPRFIPEGT